jgi:hypothetical protein
MDVKAARQFFLSITLPKEVRLNHYSLITDVQVFIDSHISTIEANEMIAQPYIDRLRELAKYLKYDSSRGKIHSR